MEAIRKIMSASDLSPFISLPWQNNDDMRVEADFTFLYHYKPAH